MRMVSVALAALLLIVVVAVIGGCPKPPSDQSAAPPADFTPQPPEPPAEPAPPPEAPKMEPAGEDSPSEAEEGKWVTTDSGLKYKDIRVGTGPTPKAGQKVYVHYVGKLKDGKKFDASKDHGTEPLDFEIGVGRVIPGWDEGVMTMKVGGRRTLVIPGDLAYGPEPPPGSGIPPNAELTFEIELVDVK